METVKGYVDHIIYRNEENGYTILVLICDGEELTCVGVFKEAGQGDTLEITGSYVEHPVYGRQLKMQEYKLMAPEDAESMRRYLGSGAVKGIGPSLADRIVKKFGEDTFRIMEEEPERLAEIRGISEKKAQEIAAVMEEKKDLREAMIFLQQYGISNTLAVKIYHTYGDGVYGVLKENPYQLAEDISGVGFRIADDIAGKIGIHTDSDYRVRSGILYGLQQSAQEGHCYLPLELLKTKSSELLGVAPEAVGTQISNLAMEQKIVVKGGCVYAHPYYYAELNCAKMLHDLNISMREEEMLAADREAMEQKIRAIEKELEIELDDLQRTAVAECIRNGLFILSGGPGTGKTTTINTMIRFFEGEGMEILLAAPTGRAAKRMTEATGYEAKTIHRMLELNGALTEETKGIRFERNEDNPLEADVIIVDEMSMVDLHLFQSLLKAVMVGTRLIMVGDVDQLPSVGPGQILRDLMDSGRIPRVVLKRIFRQAGQSDIVVNAHRINQGEEIELNNKSRDFFFLERNDVNVIYKHTVQLIRDKIPKYVDASPFDIQVLTPMRKGTLGVEALNRILQQYLNPPSPEKEEHPYGEGVFRKGDKVMQIKNNYQIEWEIVSSYGIPIDKGMGVFNGDTGVILEINDYSQTIVVEYDELRRVTYAFAQLEELELAYAITIHKSQGSEYPAVILPLLSGPRMLFNRNLLYTGVTRAKKCVTILGSSATLADMIANQSERKRYTGLSERIREFYPV